MDWRGNCGREGEYEGGRGGTVKRLSTEAVCVREMRIGVGRVGGRVSTRGVKKGQWGDRVRKPPAVPTCGTPS